MKRAKIAVALLVAAAATYGGWHWRASSSPKDSGAKKVVAELGSIEDSVEATGSVAPLNRVEIKPPISGRVEQLLVDEGDRVKAGQILAWMSSTDRAAILDAALAQGPEELKRWQDAYKPTPIVAPLSGVVILRNVVVGQTVDPATVLYAMSDTLIVVGQVDESDIGRVHSGMPARVVLDAYPDRPVEGRTFDVLYEGKNVSNVITYGVKIKFDGVPSFFRSQMTANINFIARRKDDAVLIPAAAVRETSDGRRIVAVPDPEGRAQDREIKTGIEGGGKVEVVEGLAAGDAVLLRRAKYVPQQGPQSSPLMMGGRPNAAQGQAPRPKKP